MKYTIEQVAPKIFYLKFNKKDQYSMGMLFMRYQEYYESTNSKFKNTPFKAFEYMEWYVQHTKKKTFTYTDDYIGYNIPSYSILQCFQSIPKHDNNIYDAEMAKIYYLIQEYVKGHNFYLIAGADDVTFKHELAHGLFYTNDKYRIKMLRLIEDMPIKLVNSCYKKLKRHYTSSVLPDELHAYMATGLSGSIGFDKTVVPYRKKFIEIFKSFTDAPAVKK